MGNSLIVLKNDFEQIFRRQKKFVQVDELGHFLSGCGCEGFRIRPGGLRTDILDSQGNEVIELLSDVCAQYDIAPDLGYVQLVFGSRDLVEALYMVDACSACRSDMVEGKDLAPVAIFFYGKEAEYDISA